jgi:hypothetical protein
MEWIPVPCGTRVSHASDGWNDPMMPFGRTPKPKSGRPILVSRSRAMADFEARAIGGDHIAVMLHLRSLYVSKAAILTTPVLSVPVENRSPA